MLMAVEFRKKLVEFRLILLNKVSSASSASWVGVGSVAPYN